MSGPYSYLQAGVLCLAAYGEHAAHQHFASSNALTSAPGEGPWQSSS